MYDKIMSGGDPRVDAGIFCCVFVVNTLLLGLLVGAINEGWGCKH